MWRRDPGVSAMVDWLDNGIPAKYNIDKEDWIVMPNPERFSLLTDGERQAIYEQGALCVGDFSYAAKNYFWITTKKKIDNLLSLTEGQYLILNKYYELKAKNRAQKICIIKARQLGALHPDTKVLTATLEWKRIGDLKVGDEVLAVADPDCYGKRSVRRAAVIEKWAVDKPAYRIAFADGRFVDASDDHPFMCNGLWRTVASLKPGDEIQEWKSLCFTAHKTAAKIASIAPLGVRSLVDIRTSTETFIAEGLITHNCSTLIEAMIAWRSMFFPNTNAIVVATDKDQASYLFGIMQHIYDMMPWWLKVECASRKYESGLIFDNPDANLRSVRPGMHSQVMVAMSTQFSGVGEGRRIDAAHVSEFAGYEEWKAEEIIDEDLSNAMDDNVEVFGFLETTAKGAGKYAHRLWKACESRMDRAEWYPLFLPWFFETTRVLAPPDGWRPHKDEAIMAARVRREWVRCSNPICGQYRLAVVRGERIEGDFCSECNGGKLEAVELKAEQLYWKEDKRENALAKGKASLKKHYQEMSSTAEESFQLSGYTLFDDQCHDYVNACIEDPIKMGKIYRSGEIHGAGGRDGHCYIPNCKDDHRYDATPLLVWEEPQAGREYVVGVDVSEGIGEDYSAIFVNKIGGCGIPDKQVAVWRDNNTQPKELAFYCNVIGRWYNDAMMCIEYNTYQTCGDDVVHVYQYPNVFRWKNKEIITLLTHKWHWWTKANTKSYLHQTAVHWLKNGLWEIKSKNFAHEMTVYTKDDYDSRTMGASEGFHDDELLAAMIALYCSHELDADDQGRIPVPSRIEAETPARYMMSCDGCKKKWGASNPESEYRCPECNSIRIRGRLIPEEDTRTEVSGLKFDEQGRVQIDPSAFKARSRTSQEGAFDTY